MKARTNSGRVKPVLRSRAGRPINARFPSNHRLAMKGERPRRARKVGFRMISVALGISLGAASGSVPPGSRSHGSLPQAKEHGGPLGGFSLVFTDRYLFLLALLILLLNWVNTTGEYILAEMVLDYVDQLVAVDPALDRSAEIANFYGYFFSAVNALSLLIQVLLVSRVFAWIGVQGAILILPIVALVDTRALPPAAAPTHSESPPRRATTLTPRAWGRRFVRRATTSRWPVVGAIDFLCRRR